MQKITPSLWFDTNCQEALDYYQTVFEDFKVHHIQKYPEGVTDGPMKGMEGKVLTAVFEMAGMRFIALDGGPLFTFNESISFMIDCSDQTEVDYYWSKLSAVPEAEQCGWCKDQFGVSWQIIPKQLGELISDSDPEKSWAVTQAMLDMKKIVIADLEAAHESA